jgi:hypothetical protein
MRHYGKDGPQCRPLLGRPGGPAQTCRLTARAVLFGRVPRSALLWMGSLLVLAVCVNAVNPRSPATHDPAASLLMKR